MVQKVKRTFPLSAARILHRHYTHNGRNDEALKTLVHRVAELLHWDPKDIGIPHKVTELLWACAVVLNAKKVLSWYAFTQLTRAMYYKNCVSVEAMKRALLSAS